jgi:hypothetical protein
MKTLLAFTMGLATFPVQASDVAYMVEEFTELCVSRGIGISHLPTIGQERGWQTVRALPAEPEKQFGPNLEWIVPWYGSLQNVTIKASSSADDGEAKFFCSITFTPTAAYSPGQFDRVFVKRMKVLVERFEDDKTNLEEMYDIVLDGPWQRTVFVDYPKSGAGPVTISSLATIWLPGDWWNE